MTSMTRLAGALVAAASFTVCVGAATPDSPEFGDALAEHYKALARAEQLQGDHRDALTYGRRANASAEGQPPPPEEVGLRQPFIKERYVSELSQARVRLVSALDGAGPTKAPADSARAQASYDCWVEQASEDLQPAHISACRDEFMRTIASVEQLLAVEETISPPMPAVAETTYPEKFLVFFEFDEDEVTAEGRSIVATAGAAAGEKPFDRLTATGHADRSGSDSYNTALSNRRAQAVKAALETAGVAASSIATEALGESQPLLQTEDGVREAQNRRVEILIER